MGNKSSRKLKSKEEDVKQKHMDYIFHQVNYVPPLSLTLPSKCEAPSYSLSCRHASTETVSDSFSWGHMQSVFGQHEHLTEDSLRGSILRTARQMFELLTSRQWEICVDLRNNSASLMHEEVLSRFALSMGSTKFYHQTPIDPTSVEHKLTLHMVWLLHLQKMILLDIIQNKALGLEKLTQIAISHALKGIQPIEFRMMDWFIIHYLMKNKLASEDVINFFTVYLNTVSNYIIKQYKNQTSRVSSEPQDHRYHKPRVNFRIMKKWVTTVEGYHDSLLEIETIVNQLNIPEVNEELRSIDTQTLKEQDWLLKYFVKRTKWRDDEEPEQKLESTSGYNASTTLTEVTAGPSTVDRTSRSMGTT